MRTIKIDMTWTTAARIIAAALENGTDKGRDAARAELFRMAEILDAQRVEQLADKTAPLVTSREDHDHAIRTNTDNMGALRDVILAVQGHHNGVALGWAANDPLVTMYVPREAGAALLRDLLTALDRAGLLE